jgi:hypothetical protein
MSTVNNGPQIVRSGLVLDLDAGNGKSYSTNRFQSLGSGTVTENVTFAINGDGTFQRVASGTVIGGYTIRPNDVVYSYVLGANGCHYHGNTAPIPGGVYATFSFDYLVTGATNYPSTNHLANFENYGAGALSGYVAAANSLQNVWQRLTFTSGPTSTAGTQAMFLYPGSCGGRLADSGTIYFRNPKVEWTNVDTGNSTFNSTSNIGLWYDLSGNGYNGTLTNGPTSNVSNKGNILFDGSDDEITTNLPLTNFPASSNFTFETWAKITAYPAALAANQYGATYQAGVLMGATYYGGVALYWYGNNAGNAFTLYGFIRGADAYRNTSGYNFSLNLWYHCVLVNIGGGTISLFINGTLFGSVATATLPYDSANTPTAGNIGISKSQIDGGGTANYKAFGGHVASARAYNRALTAAEISQNYEATKTKFGL